ncbi:MAG: serine hydrolase domain-containing protein [Isosphaeraceae bacterium]
MVNPTRWTPALAFAGLALLGTTLARADEPKAVALPDTPAGKQAARLFEAIGSGDREKIKAFIEQNFAAGFLAEFPLAQHVDVNARMASETGGLVPREILTSEPTRLRLLAGTKKGKGQFQVGVQVEEAPPHKIAGIGFMRPQPSAKVTPPPTPEGPRPLGHDQIAAWTREYLDRLTKADAFSGAVLLAQGDRVIVAEARGLASRAWNVPNRLDTKFNLGSMNKMFTAIAIAQLVEQSKVSLDDPIGKHLPDYASKDAARKVTVRHLLGHTSGLADYFNDNFMKASRDRFRTVADYFPLFEKEPLQFEPGARFRYSNAGFMVLGAIVQKASGMDYFDYVREHIYKPAGMINTDAYELDTDVPNLAVGYTRGEGDGPGTPAVKNNVFLHVIKGGPAGGGYSTVEDLHRFATALREGKLVRPETFRQWTTPGEKTPNYAFGFQIFQAEKPRVVGHSGGFPGISSVLCIDLDEGYTLAVLSNIDGGSMPVQENLRRLLTASGVSGKSPRGCSRVT